MPRSNAAGLKRRLSELVVVPSLSPSLTSQLPFGACCLDVRTLTLCQLMGFPLNHEKLNF